MGQHRCVGFIKSSQYGWRARRSSLFTSGMVETKSAGNEQQRNSVRKYQLLKNLCICPCKRQQGGVPVCHTPPHESCHTGRIIGRIAPHPAKPLLFQPVLLDCEVVGSHRPRTFYRGARIKVEFSQGVDDFRRRKPFAFARPCITDYKCLHGYLSFMKHIQ